MFDLILYISHSVCCVLTQQNCTNYDLRCDCNKVLYLLSSHPLMTIYILCWLKCIKQNLIFKINTDFHFISYGTMPTSASIVEVWMQLLETGTVGQTAGYLCLIGTQEDLTSRPGNGDFLDPPQPILVAADTGIEFPFKCLSSIYYCVVSLVRPLHTAQVQKVGVHCALSLSHVWL